MNAGGERAEGAGDAEVKDMGTPNQDASGLLSKSFARRGSVQTRGEDRCRLQGDQCLIKSQTDHCDISQKGASPEAGEKTADEENSEKSDPSCLA